MSESASERIEKGFEQLRQMLAGNRAEEVRKQWHQISPDFESLVLGVLAGELDSASATWHPQPGHHCGLDSAGQATGPSAEY
jgi:hypothetical protein